MAKTLIDIPEEKLIALDEIALQRAVSRASLVRSAIDEFLKQQIEPKNVFGILKNDKIAPLELEQKLRNEWK
jgi:hypothetical protein